MFHFFNIIMLASMVMNSNQLLCISPLTDCSRENVSFHLYTSDDKEPHELILNDPETLKHAKFNRGADFKFIFHGYTQSKDTPMMAQIRHEYFKDEEWNIIYIDYHPLAHQGCYYGSAVPSAPQIGRCAASLLKQLFNIRSEVTIDQFHFIGFSLGAQICAQVSKHLRPLRIPRITGCDPAFPGFFGGTQDSIDILNKQHADFVDVIHTNMGVSGVYLSDAHYDIYADDGTAQPGCYKNPVCCHARALQIFTESINSSVQFIAVKCLSYYLWFSVRSCSTDGESRIVVGEHCSPPESDDEMGIYQFNTNYQSPFALGPPTTWYG
ncbi:endothelial lipase-like [Planococcus citri]|uniref:endothelial lipase-like n=1 Tax=Planococcus citri TaxID=170843 RepID=UPI0031F99529